MAFDGDPGTAWNEADEGSAIGERIELTLEREITVDTIEVMGGYIDSRYFQKNNRVKTLEVRTETDSMILPLKDEMKARKLRLSRPIAFKRVVFEIRETYQGTKWNDTSIAEIAFHYQGMKIKLVLPKAGVRQQAGSNPAA